MVHGGGAGQTGTLSQRRRVTLGQVQKLPLALPLSRNHPPVLHCPTVHHAWSSSFSSLSPRVRRGGGGGTALIMKLSPLLARTTPPHLSLHPFPARRQPPFLPPLRREPRPLPSDWSEVKAFLLPSLGGRPCLSTPVCLSDWRRRRSGQASLSVSNGEGGVGNIWVLQPWPVCAAAAVRALGSPHSPTPPPGWLRAPRCLWPLVPWGAPERGARFAPPAAPLLSCRGGEGSGRCSRGAGSRAGGGREPEAASE